MGLKKVDMCNGWEDKIFIQNFGKETRYPFYRRLGGLQGRSGRVRKMWPPHREFFFIFPYTLYFIRTSFFVLIAVHFAFT